MSTKKEIKKNTPSTVEDNSVRYNTSRSTHTYSDSFLSDHYRSIDKTLEETKQNIRRSIEKARQEAPHNTQAINHYQPDRLQKKLPVLT